jgi:hypothetical protein
MIKTIAIPSFLSILCTCIYPEVLGPEADPGLFARWGQREELRSDPPVSYLNKRSHGQGQNLSSISAQVKLSLLRSNSLKFQPLFDI